MRKLGFVALLALVGCSGNEIQMGDDDVGDDGGNQPVIDAGVTVDDAGRTIDAAVPRDSSVITIDSGPSTGPRKDQVCMRWKADRVDRAEGTFTGMLDPQCVPGDVTAPGRANALKLINMYRFIADLPAVTNDPAKDTKAQACAIMMDANNALSHTPPTTWKCYSTDGAAAAGMSNIASTAGVSAIDLYMNDRGNASTMGHRRWLLSNSLGPVGLGSAPGGSCATVIGGSGRAGKPWMAWPAPGPFPFEAMSTGGFGMTIDVTGWTFQSDGINLTNATVTVTEGGQNRPVTITHLGANYGSTYAISFTANGWVSGVGKTYHVVIGGITNPVTYDVEMVACP